MSHVVVERVFDRPVTLAALRAMSGQGARCLAEHRVNYFGSFLGDAGRRMTCLYAAPDAESVRITSRRLRVPFERAWTAQIHGPAGGDLLSAPVAAGAICVMVERAFPGPVAFAEVQAQEDRHAWCLEAHGVRFLRSYFAADRRRMLCVYAGPDAEAVRQVQVTAGLPVERVWAAEVWWPKPGAAGAAAALSSGRAAPR